MSIAPRVSTGSIAWINHDTGVIEVTAPTDKGNSGGPVVNSEAAVVGIIVYAREGAVSEAYYVLSMERLSEALSDAGIPYGVHYPWESRWVITIALGVALPIAIIFLGGGRR